MNLTKLGRVGLAATVFFGLCRGYGQDSAAPSSPTTPGLVAPAVNTPPNFAAVFNPSKDVAEVVKLSKAGVGDDVVLAFVKNSRSFYNLRADGILQLKEAGVSAEVITAMLNHDRSMRDQSPGQHFSPPPPSGYNQQPYPPGSQPEPGQEFPQPPPPDAQGPDMSGAQPPPPQTEIIP